MWRELNCDECAKDWDGVTQAADDGKNALCDIEYAIAYASVDDGMIDKAIADRAGLPFRDGNIIEKCPEFVPVTEAVWESQNK
ncbi:MAG TPA: hypothetical protein DCS09_08590 [Porphyromonadaceae bacterium]|nr:hypothetical protein [Porphyromonadaceae bacterium]